MSLVPAESIKPITAEITHSCTAIVRTVSWVNHENVIVIKLLSYGVNRLICHMGLNWTLTLYFHYLVFNYSPGISRCNIPVLHR
jgi:hypothetical protein